MTSLTPRSGIRCRRCSGHVGDVVSSGRDSGIACLRPMNHAAHNSLGASKKGTRRADTSSTSRGSAARRGAGKAGRQNADGAATATVPAPPPDETRRQTETRRVLYRRNGHLGAVGHATATPSTTAAGVAEARGAALAARDRAASRRPVGVVTCRTQPPAAARAAWRSRPTLPASSRRCAAATTATSPRAWRGRYICRRISEKRRTWSPFACVCSPPCRGGWRLLAPWPGDGQGGRGRRGHAGRGAAKLRTPLRGLFGGVALVGRPRVDVKAPSTSAPPAPAEHHCPQSHRRRALSTPPSSDRHHGEEERTAVGQSAPVLPKPKGRAPRGEAVEGIPGAGPRGPQGPAGRGRQGTAGGTAGSIQDREARESLACALSSSHPPRAPPRAPSPGQAPARRTKGVMKVLAVTAAPTSSFLSNCVSRTRGAARRASAHGNYWSAGKV